MEIDSRLLEILACPACMGSVEPAPDRDALRCLGCGRTYPVRDGIPVMIVEEAEEPNGSERSP